MCLYFGRKNFVFKKKCSFVYCVFLSFCLFDWFWIFLCCFYVSMDIVCIYVYNMFMNFIKIKEINRKLVYIFFWIYEMIFVL